MGERGPSIDRPPDCHASPPQRGHIALRPARSEPGEKCGLALLGVDEGTLRPYWWDGSEWVLGGTTLTGEQGEGVFAGINVDRALYGIGYCGLNTVDDYVWSHINHASDYGVGGFTPPIPEPAGLGLVGLAALALRRR